MEEMKESRTEGCKGTECIRENVSSDLGKFS